MQFLIAIIGPFVNEPIKCVLVATAFTIPLFLRYSTKGEKIILGASASAWWLFLVWDLQFRGHSDVWRIDLLFAAPVLVAAMVGGAWCTVLFVTRAGGWAEVPRAK